MENAEISRRKSKGELPWKLAAIILMGLAGLRAREALSVNHFSLEKDNEGMVWVRVRGKGRREKNPFTQECIYRPNGYERKDRQFSLEVHYQTL